MLRRRFRLDEFLAEKLVTGVAFISLATIVMIFVFVFREALPIFSTSEKTGRPVAVEESETYGEEFLGDTGAATDEEQLRSESVETAGAMGDATAENLLGTQWQPVSREPKYGLLPLVVGSLKVTLLAILMAAPIAILAALFTSSFAPRWSKEILKPAIEILAGFPSVVIGFFALVTLASVLQNRLRLSVPAERVPGRRGDVAGGHPDHLYGGRRRARGRAEISPEASLALGATRWQTALFVTLPAATPGVFAAVLLGFGRAFGETMIVLMATGNAALLSANLFEPVRTMSATIGAEMAEVVFGDTHYNVLFLLGAILFLFTFSLNAVAEVFIRQRLLKRFRGG